MSDSFDKWFSKEFKGFDLDGMTHDISKTSWQAATEQQQSVIAELVEALRWCISGLDEYFETENEETVTKYRVLLAKVKGVKSE